MKKVGVVDMDERYICYCGLYCENCAVRARINPVAKTLHNEMKAAGFEEIIHLIPGGDGFWPFLKYMGEIGMCTSCREGSGDPGCTIRICAKEKGVELCAFCNEYPCERINVFLTMHSALKSDNELLREKGMEAWSKLQDERRSRGYVFQDDYRPRP